jgi:acyl-CoA synthetase (AMP-forming)/AMP-acid ligase II/aryl carrier-like protein
MKLNHVQTLDELYSVSLLQRMQAVADTIPDKVAVKSPDAEITYADLNARADELAQAILQSQENTSTPKHYVALLFEHGIDMIIALLATIKSGHAYLPLDAAYPVERLAYMCEAAGDPVIVTNLANARLAQVLSGTTVKTEAENIFTSAAGTNNAVNNEKGLANPPQADSADVPHTRSQIIVLEDIAHSPTNKSKDNDVDSCYEAKHLERPAYLLFTSGSTGKPKGVSQTAGNLLYHTWVWVKRLEITDSDRLTLQSAYSWDSSVQDIFSSLLCGATLYPFSLKNIALKHVLQWLQEEAATVYHSTLPIYRSVTKILASGDVQLPAMRMLALGGDSIYRADIDSYKALFPGNCKLAYAYGSTESSSTLMKVIDPSFVPERNTLELGTADELVEVYLKPLPEQDQLATASGHNETTNTLFNNSDTGTPGEIMLKSRFICPGYLKLDAQGGISAESSAAFVPDKTHPEIIHYHTGDLGVALPNGDIALVGRKDNKLKVRGMRVEMQEVEGALNDLPPVDQAVVKTFEDDEHNISLAAFIVLNAGPEKVTATEIRALLKDRLPEHAIPTRYSFQANLPLTPNGKIDRAALPVPSQGAAERPNMSTRFIAPASELQQQITGIWCDVLGLSKIGVNDNFFDLGGQSILMIRVHEQLERAVNQKIPLVKLYANPTVRSIAGYLQNGNERSASLSSAQMRSDIRKNRLRRKSTRIKSREEMPAQ